MMKKNKKEFISILSVFVAVLLIANSLMCNPIKAVASEHYYDYGNLKARYSTYISIETPRAFSVRTCSSKSVFDPDENFDETNIDGNPFSPPNIEKDDGEKGNHEEKPHYDPIEKIDPSESPMDKIESDFETKYEEYFEGQNHKNPSNKNPGRFRDVNLVITTVSMENEDQPVPNCEVTLLDSKGNIVLQQQSNYKGQLHIKELEIGTYQVYISKGAEGIMGSGKQSLVVHEDGSGDGDTTLVGTLQGSVVIGLTNSKDHYPIERAKVLLMHSDGTKIEEKETDIRGNVSFAIPNIGEYKFKVTGVPSGIVLNDEEYTFKVSDGFQIEGVTQISLDTTEDYVPTSAPMSVDSGASGNGENYDAATLATVNPSSTYSNGDVNQPMQATETVPETGLNDPSSKLLIIAFLMFLISYVSYDAYKQNIDIKERKGDVNAQNA